MLRGHERPDEVEWPLIDGGQILLGVVPLVEDQGDVANALAEHPAPFCQFLGHTREGHTVVLVTGIGVMKQRNVAVGSDQQSQAENAQVVSPLFTLAALREVYPVVETVDEGEEVCGVKKETPQIQAEVGNRCGGNVSFNLADGLFVDAIHVVPKALATQLRALDPEEAGQDGVVIPCSDLRLAVREDAPVEASDQEVFAHGWSLGSPLGDMSVDRGHGIELLGYVEGGDQGAKFTDDDLLGLRSREATDQLLRGADVFLPDDLRLAVNALALPEVVVGSTADHLLG